jgi:hypothetical protein
MLGDEAREAATVGTTLTRRLEKRGEDEWGGKASEREMLVRLYAAKEDLPKTGVVIDTTMPIERVVDEILAKCI